MNLSLTNTGSCVGGYAGNLASEPMTPNGDCRNDLLLITFPELIDPITGAAFSIPWSGKNDSGFYVATGGYTVVARETDPYTGTPKVQTGSVSVVDPTVDKRSATLGKEEKKGFLLGPNFLDAGDRLARINVAVHGEPGGTVEMTVYDEAGHADVPYPGTGKKLAPGVYWMRASGGGVGGKKPFRVFVGKK
jgi:hypothetical protein